jgi:multidrug efflux pump subunit AcrB
MNIGKFSVQNSVLLNMLMVGILFFGSMAFMALPRELWSEISFSTVWIAVPYPGVSAEDIEKSITIPIEEELSDLDKLKRITSVSRQGVSFVSVEFEDNVDKAEFKSLFQDLRAEFDKVQLPENALDAQINEFTTSDFMPVIQIVIRGTQDDAYLYKLAENLRDKVLEIPEASKAEIIGSQERQVIIEANKQKLQAYGVSIDDIAAAVQRRNLNIPGGELDVESRSWLVRTVGEVQTVPEFGNTIIRRIPGAGVVTVGDVSTVIDGFGKSEYDNRFNGEKSISLFISKKNGSSSFAIVDKIKNLVQAEQQKVPEWVTIQTVSDTSFYIREIMDTLGSNSVMGLILVVVVLFFFLGLRNSIITSMGIPLAFGITFIAMNWYGESLNGNSLFALVLVLGMIVDHAIVIVENAYRHRLRGLSARDAAIIGTNEVARPIIASTLTTVAAFLPAMLITGVMGKFMRVIPLVVCFALVASTIEALLFLPLHVSEWGGKVRKAGKGFIWLRTRFQKRMVSLYRRRYLTFIGSMVVMAIILGMAGGVKQDMFAGEQMPQFTIDVKMATGTKRSETDRILQKIEGCVQQFQGKGEVVDISSSTGFVNTGDDWITASHRGQILVDLTKISEGRKRAIPVIMQEIKTTCGTIPGAEQIAFKLQDNGPPVDKPVSFRVQGDDYSELQFLAEEFKAILRKHPSILYNVTDNYEKGAPEFLVQVKEDAAAELGLSPAQIGMQIRNAIDGVEVGSYFDQDEEIDVWVRLPEEQRNSESDLLSLMISTPMGQQVPFSAVAIVSRHAGIGTIKRYEQKREILITAESWDETQVPPILDSIQQAWDNGYASAYPGVTLAMGGAFADFQNFINEFVALLFVGIALMYLILGTQFKSYLQPLLMLFTLFFAGSGCVAFLLVSGTPFSVVVAFAGMALAGICVNDAIVMISYINSLRRGGMGVMRAVIQGSVTRLRPVILTSVTTIGGLLPMALGMGGSNTTWGPMASTIVFGLLFSTVGTLVIIPCAYGILDDVLKKFGIQMRLEGE